MDLLWLPGQQHILFKVFILIFMLAYTLSIVVFSICFYISAIIYYLVENMYLWPIEVFWILSFNKYYYMFPWGNFVEYCTLVYFLIAVCFNNFV